MKYVCCLSLFILITGCVGGGASIGFEAEPTNSVDNGNDNNNDNNNNDNLNENTPPANMGSVSNLQTKVAGDGIVEVTWDNSGDIDSHKVVYKQNSTPTDCNDGDSVTTSSGTDNSILVTGLVMGQNYEFIVCPVKDNYESFDNAPTAEPQSLALSTDLSFVYPTNGDAWNEYVDNDGADEYSASNTTCSTAGTGYFSCIHGGERLVFEVTGLESCTDYTAEDNLQVFDWSCVSGTGKISFYSKLKKNKGLRHLVDATDWKDNFVSVKFGTEIVASTTANKWWPNSVLALPDNTGSGVSVLTNSGTDGDIYTVATTMSTDGFNFNSDKMALVVFDGAQVNYDLNSDNCNRASGETASANSSCAFAVGGQNFFWAEGKLVGDRAKTNQDYGLMLSVSSFSHLRHLDISDFRDGLKVDGTTHSYLYQLHLYSNREDGLDIGSSANSNIYQELVIADNDNFGADIDTGSDFNAFINLKVTGNVTGGFHSNNATDNTFVGFLVSNNADDGFKSENNSNRITVTHISSINNGDNGTQFYQTDNSVMANGLFVNNLGMGFENTTADNNQIHNIASFSNNERGVSSLGATGVSFSGTIKVGGNNLGDCTNSGTGPGINSDCSASGTSTHTVLTGLDLTYSFVGKISADDTTNADDANGTLAYDSLADMTNFDNFFRAWGDIGSTFPNTDNMGRCATGETCVIWDYRLYDADTSILNRSNGSLTANEAFTAGSNCPASAHGNQTITDGHVTPNTFLVNAIEIIADFSGDDDGLCESGERCIYTPNVGAYQGEGDYEAAGSCTFQDGTVTGVTLYAYPTNGVPTPTM